jgi:hypothetical protein
LAPAAQKSIIEQSERVVRTQALEADVNSPGNVIDQIARFGNRAEFIRQSAVRLKMR